MWELLSYLFALLPAIYVAGAGRSLVRHLDDPAFPELHLRKIQRLGSVLVVAMVLSLVVSSQHAVLKLALAMLGVAVAEFPSRRKIFQESWGLFAYLAHGIRFWGAFLGALTLLVFLPEIVYYSGSWALPVALVLGVSILLWDHFYFWIFPRILGAVPFEHPELESRFAAVLRKAECRKPKLWRYGPRGGNVVNAFALPSLYPPGVVFSNCLLEVLGPREMTAVFAHELHHLEHHDRRRLALKQAGLALTVAAVLFLLFYFGPTSVVARTLTWVWPLACLLMLARSFAKNQAQEHESDLRAVELCGDPQAVADGLAKIHLLTAMPRRWGAQDERQMSHPSLAQRLRAIHEASGDDPGPEAGSEEAGSVVAVRAAGDPTRAVVLAADRLHWLSGLPPDAELDPGTALSLAGDARAIRYGDLIDLRLEIGAFGSRYLKATDRDGKAMKMPLEPADVAAVKAGLERFDRHVLGTAPEAPPEIAATAGHQGLRFEAVLALLVAMAPPFTAPLVLAGLLVLIRPALTTLAAAGGIGIASAVLGWWWPPESWFAGEASVQVTLAGQAVFGLLFLWQAWQTHRRQVPEPRWVTWMALVTLGAFTALSAIGVVFRVGLPYPLLQIHRWARHSPGLVLLLIGTAVALWCGRRWLARLPALGLVALAVSVVFVGSSMFRQRFSGDPLRTVEPRLRLETAALEKVRSVPVEGWTTNLVLSPSGERLAAGFWGSGDEYDYEGGQLKFAVENAGGGLVEIKTNMLEFIDDDRIALLTFEGEEIKLSTVSLKPVAVDGAASDSVASDRAEAAGEVEIVLPTLLNPRLWVDGSHWQVTGSEYGGADAERQTLVRLSGIFDEPGFERQSWSLEPASSEVYFHSLQVSSAGRVLAIGNDTGIDEWWFFMILPFLGGYVGSYEVATLGPEGQRHLLSTTMDLTCFDPAPGESDFHCLTSELGLAQLWTVDPEAGRFTPVGSLPGDYWQAHAIDDGRLLLSGFSDSLALVDPAAGWASMLGGQIEPGSAFGTDSESEEPEHWLFELLNAQNYSFLDATAMAVRSGHVAVAVRNGETTRVDVYRLPARSGTS